MLAQTRQDTRNKVERRLEDRRKVDYKFGSPEWITYVKKTYAAWPKEDRRQAIRRDGERRQGQQEPTNTDHIHHDYSSDLLTDEEKLFFDNLFLNGNK